MQTLLFLLWLVQPSPCSDGAAALVADAATRAAASDTEGALEVLGRAAALGCAEARVGQIYLRGLIAARDAYAAGGSRASLGGVDDAVAALDGMGVQSPPARIAAYVLRAAGAAAQSERDEMGLFLSQAVQLESLQLAAGEPGAPMISAHEAAGELWLRVHRYDMARQAFVVARTAVGPTGRVRLGLARAQARLDAGPGACPDALPTCP